MGGLLLAQAGKADPVTARVYVLFCNRLYSSRRLVAIVLVRESYEYSRGASLTHTQLTPKDLQYTAARPGAGQRESSPDGQQKVPTTRRPKSASLFCIFAVCRCLLQFSRKLSQAVVVFGSSFSLAQPTAFSSAPVCSPGRDSRARETAARHTVAVASCLFTPHPCSSGSWRPPCVNALFVESTSPQEETSVAAISSYCSSSQMKESSPPQPGINPLEPNSSSSSRMPLGVSRAGTCHSGSNNQVRFRSCISPTRG